MMKLFELRAGNMEKPVTEAPGDASTGASLRALALKVGTAGEDQVSTGTLNHLHALASKAGLQAYTDHVENIRTLTQAGRYQVDYTELGSSLVDALLRGD